MSLRVPLQHYPGMNRFVLDWLGGDQRFLKRKVHDRRRPALPPGDLVTALKNSNRRWGLFVDRDLDNWASGQTVTLIAGQQAGFAGGPLYTLAKIATLLKMKREIEARGTPVTAFFWMATEDHDFDEVAQVSVPVRTIEREGINRQLDLLCVRATRPVESKVAVGPLPVPDALITELRALYDVKDEPWLRDGITFGDSFAELIAKAFPQGLVLVDSLLPELRRAGAPLFAQLSERWSEVQIALRERAATLESAGYTPQVEPREIGDYTLFFELDEQGERRIVESPRALEPEKTSTSALTRPLLQDVVLQPDVFVGGPAEVAYYAQIAPLYEMLGVELPRVALRGHVLVAPKRVLKFIERYEIAPAQIFGSPDELLTEREPEAVDTIRREAAEAERDLLARIERIGQLALPADHALARAINKSIGHIEYHFRKLTERAIRGVVRKDKDRYNAARELVATLYPDRHVQDRIVGWFPFWWRDREHLIERIIDEVEPDSDVFKVVEL